MTHDTTRVYDVVHPGDLSSNLVRLREDGDDSDPKEISRRASESRTMEGFARFTVATNTYFPEVSGGYYENWWLVHQLHDAVIELGLCSILESASGLNGLIPKEPGGWHELGEEYLLIKDKQLVGRVLMWKLNVGGGSEYYRDALVIDCLTSMELTAKFRAAIESQCKRFSIRFELWCGNRRMTGPDLLPRY